MSRENLSGVSSQTFRLLAGLLARPAFVGTGARKSYSSRLGATQP